MWSRSLLVLNPLIPKKATPRDSDVETADAVAEKPVSSETQTVPPPSRWLSKQSLLMRSQNASDRCFMHVQQPA